MEHAPFIGSHKLFPFGARLRRDVYFSSNNDSIHTQKSQPAIFTSLVVEQISSNLGINFTVNARCEFTCHPCRADRAVPIDEMQSCPHRGASWAQGLADWLRFTGGGEGQLR